MTDSLLVSTSAGVATITLNRPESLNALNREVWKAIGEAAVEVGQDPDARVVVLRGAGPRAFSAGLDVKAAVREGVDAGAPARDTFNRITAMQLAFTAIENCPLPVIASIHGYCLGGALELALCCDIRICCEDAVFGLPEVGLGIMPDMGSTQRLPRVVGPGMARELVYTSRRIAAREAERIGLVNHVYTADELEAETQRLASEIAGNSPVAVQNSKRALNIAASAPLAVGLQFETAMALSGLSDGNGASFAERGAQIGSSARS
ncbi:MAG: enoyl-CoA hydratase/isomerase family protein [Dehalococcoidia bacterium]